MNKLSKIIAKYPIGIGLLICHWIIALTAFFNLQVDNFSNISQNGEFATLTLLILFALDSPAIIVPAILFSPALVFDNLYFVLLAIAAFFTISFQWLFVGRKIYGIFRKSDLEIEELGILK